MGPWQDGKKNKYMASQTCEHTRLILERIALEKASVQKARSEADVDPKDIILAISKARWGYFELIAKKTYIKGEA